MKKKIFKTFIIVSILSTLVIGSVSAAEYTTKERLNSQGVFQYHDPASGDDVIFDTGDFVTIANTIDTIKTNLATASNSASAKIGNAKNICR